ncbi:cuticle protein CP1499-like [Cherax quadricarinatus]|uniref:cuticle protein CP1499-like n=1 Tax=Cherax quadricarinatus TaxID=27406 RepID=UPI0023796C46|nr:cuticle protein CP1876-like [Cherax quadricarinatus]
MRSLVVLAVIGVCSGGYQAYNPGYGYDVQPKYVGPVASVIPAGVDGKIIPVSDTYEVAAAKDAFFKAYNDQLDVIKSRRYGTPGYASTLPVYKASVAPAFISGGAYGLGSGSYGGPVGSYGVSAGSYGVPAGSIGVPAGPLGVPAGPLGVSSQSFGASIGAYGVPTASYGGPPGAYKNPGYHGPPTQVPDTPEVSAAKHEFFKLYDKQAAAAAAAPDLYTYH